MDKSLKEGALRKVALEIERCKICKKGAIGKAVPGEGNPDAKIVFVGEAPGRKEAETGRPFVGRSGKFLREQIRNIGLDENKVYITSPVKYLPKSGTPSLKTIDHSRMHFFKQLEIINPDIVVLLGSVAELSVLGKKFPVMKVRGSVIKQGKIKYFLAIHPSAAIRFKKFKSVFIEDFEKLKKLIKQNGK